VQANELRPRSRVVCARSSRDDRIHIRVCPRMWLDSQHLRRSLGAKIFHTLPVVRASTRTATAKIGVNTARATVSKGKAGITLGSRQVPAQQRQKTARRHEDTASHSGCPSIGANSASKAETRRVGRQRCSETDRGLQQLLYLGAAESGMASGRAFRAGSFSIILNVVSKVKIALWTRKPLPSAFGMVFVTRHPQSDRAS